MQRRRYLIVDGHSVVFAWPELSALHDRRTSLAREALVKRLRDYQDWTETLVVVVFDGQGPEISEVSEPDEVQVFYSRRGQTADAVVERLAAKYAAEFDILVASSDNLVQQTVLAFGAEWISTDGLRALLDNARRG